ncbi:phosphatidate cytidylyltransferase [Shimia sediminis]|uniref:phosphatidate cytidylyltransferase n=1 Tax=Shimia sediminis TaxID=2497945 RepID=UPI0013DF638E|nr:phosphatidate cytidylyltransferase [Shimia sediminis]
MLLVTVTTLAVFWGGPFTLVPFLILLAFRTGYEAAHVLLGKTFAVRIGLGSALIAAITASLPILAFMFAGAWALLLARRVMVPAATGVSVSKLIDLFLYPILPVAILTAATLDPELRPMILILYVLVELFDSMAYASGKFLGRTPAFPVLSPRKTVEGLAGGAVSILVIAIGTSWVVGLSVIQSATLTLFACVLGVAGDLAGSRIKRAGKVKDYPPVLKKQGGALDIWDSWIAAGAAFFVLVAIRDML